MTFAKCYVCGLIRRCIHNPRSINTQGISNKDLILGERKSRVRIQSRVGGTYVFFKKNKTILSHFWGVNDHFYVFCISQ